MEVDINKTLVDKMKAGQLSGQGIISIVQLKEIYSLLLKKDSKVVQIKKQCFVSFAELPNIEFQIIDFKNKKDFEFLNKSSKSIYIDASKDESGYLKFLLNELFAGKNFFSRIYRFIQPLLLLTLLNVLIYMFASSNSIQQTFFGLLSAASIFVAIFSLFTLSHEYLQRKKLFLFEEGKLGYYFSVDRHITTTGFLSIVFSIFGLVSTGAENTIFTNRTYYDLNNMILIVLLNMAFLCVFIVLRSIVEFYVSRPAAYIMGDLKHESLKKYLKENHKSPNRK